MELSGSSGFMFAIVTERVLDIDAFFPIMGRKNDLELGADWYVKLHAYGIMMILLPSDRASKVKGR